MDTEYRPAEGKLDTVETPYRRDQYIMGGKERGFITDKNPETGDTHRRGTFHNKNEITGEEYDGLRSVEPGDFSGASKNNSYGKMDEIDQANKLLGLKGKNALTETDYQPAEGRISTIDTPTETVNHDTGFIRNKRMDDGEWSAHERNGHVYSWNPNNPDQHYKDNAYDVPWQGLNGMDGSNSGR